MYFNFVLQTISALLHDSICDPPAYFWGKINQSLEVVQRATGRSIDDVVLIVHLIIQEIEVFGQGPIVHQGGKTYKSIIILHSALSNSIIKTIRQSIIILSDWISTSSHA